MLQTLTTEFSKIKRTCAVTSKKISILKRGLKSKEYDKRLEEWRKVGKSLSFYKNELIRILTGEFKNSNTENTKVHTWKKNKKSIFK